MKSVRRTTIIEAAKVFSPRNDRLDIEIEVSVTSDHNFYTGFTTNISEGGLFVATNLVRAVGTELEFTVKLAPDPKPVRVTGIVRWVREPNPLTRDFDPGMGIEFTNLAPQLRERINDFIVERRESIFFDV